MRAIQEQLIFNDHRFKSSETWDFEKPVVRIDNQFFESSRSSIFVDEDSFYKLIKTKNYIKSKGLTQIIRNFVLSGYEKKPIKHV